MIKSEKSCKERYPPFVELKSGLNVRDKCQTLGILNRQGERINKAISGITKGIEDMKKIVKTVIYIQIQNILNSKIILLCSTRFTHDQIDKQELSVQFGSLLAFECSYWIFPVQTTNPEQHIITQIDTEYRDTNDFSVVSE